MKVRVLTIIFLLNIKKKGIDEHMTYMSFTFQPICPKIEFVIQQKQIYICFDLA